MKICYLGGGLDVPSVRFRLPFLEQLRERGHQCDIFSSFPSRYNSFSFLGWRLSQKLKRLVRYWHQFQIGLQAYDVVILESGLFHTSDFAIEQKIRSVAKRLIYDFDDALFLVFPEKTAALARMADHVIVANANLAHWAKEYNSNISIIPTCVDAIQYTAKKYTEQGELKRPVIGWIGSTGNIRMLDVCALALRTLARGTEFEFRVVAAANHRLDQIDLSGVNTHWVDIDRCNIIEQLHQFDVGIMPLPAEDPWMVYKCNAKMIQYMAVGLPAVGSAIGFNLELVEHGVNSMLAANSDQWLQCLKTLMDSPSLCQKLGQAGRQKILDGFTVQSKIDLYEQILLGEKP